MHIPASHRSDTVSLPPIPVKSWWSLSPGSVVDKTFLDALMAWHSDTSSNLLVVMGTFGAGKTTGLQEFSAARGVESEIVSFEHLSSNERTFAQEQIVLQSPIIIIDNFDAINDLSGRQVDPPDLRAISSLASTHRVVLATRRSPSIRGDELLAQVSSEQRLSIIGFRNPVMVNLLPWSLADLESFALKQDTKGTNPLALVTAYLGELHPADAEGLCRPLLIRMLMRLASRPEGLSSRISLSLIYKEYCSAALANDYDNGRSRIPGVSKEDILSELAYDIFAGLSPRFDMPTDSLSLPLERVSERVLEVMMRSPAFRQQKSYDYYDWTEDFVSTNHIFSKLPAARLPVFSDGHYGFVHQTYYEYFVGLALCKRMSSGKTLGLEIERLSMATVDSLAVAFVKELGGKELRDAVRDIISRPRLSSADRLVLLYLLEDEPDFASLVESAPPEYLDELHTLEKTVKSFLLKKMIRYQLVIAGKYDATTYVSEVRQYEDESALQAEIRLHSAETHVVQQLLQRLKNPALARARPITIYRLGQLGGDETIRALEWVVAGSDSQVVSQAAKDAMNRIRERQGAKQ